LDYTHPFGKSNQIETGYKGTYRVNDNDYHSDTLNYSSGNYVDNINLSNHFKLSEMINAVYFMFGSKIKGLSFKFGLRLENTNSKSEFGSRKIIAKSDAVNTEINLIYKIV